MGDAASPMLSSQPVSTNNLCLAECDRGLHQLGEFFKTWAMGLAKPCRSPRAKASAGAAKMPSKGLY